MVDDGEIGPWLPLIHEPYHDANRKLNAPDSSQPQPTKFSSQSIVEKDKPCQLSSSSSSISEASDIKMPSVMPQCILHPHDFPDLSRLPRLNSKSVVKCGLNVKSDLAHHDTTNIVKKTSAKSIKDSCPFRSYMNGPMNVLMDKSSR